MSTNSNQTGINPKELTPETYDIYCRLYLIQELHKVVSTTSLLNYGHIYTLIQSMDPILFKNINTKTGKTLLLNDLYALFMSVGEEFNKDFLYEKIEYIAKNDPALYGEV